MPADAPDLRPKTDATSDAPMETGLDHQIGHLNIHIPDVEGETVDVCAARIAATLRSHGVDPSSLVPLVIGEEPLTKVLPAGEPLVSTCWTCPQCGYSKPGAPPPACVSDDPCCPLGSAS